MDRKGVLIIVITFGLALTYHLLVAVPRQNAQRKEYLEQVAAKQKADAEARAEAERKESERVKSLPVNVMVSAQLPGGNVEAIKSGLVAPLESELTKLENYDSNSPNISADGQLKLTVRFKPGTDSAKAREGVQKALDAAKAKFPTDAKVAGVDAESPAQNSVTGNNAKVSEATPQEPAKTVTMTNQSGTVEYVFTEDGGGISTVTLKEHFLNKDNKGPHTYVRLNEFGDAPIGALSTPDVDPARGGPDPNSQNTRWTMLPPNQDARTVSFERIDSREVGAASWKIKITKKFTLAPAYAERRDQLKGEYLVGLEVTYENLGAVPADPVYYLNVGSSSPTTINDQSQYQSFDWYHNGAHQTKLVDWYQGGGLIFKDPKRDFYQENTELTRWVGVTSQYFCTILTVPGPSDQPESDQVRLLGTAAWSHRTDISNESWLAAGHTVNTGKTLHQLTAAMALPKVVLGKAGAGDSVAKRSYQIYAGPREYRRLRLLDHNEDTILNYGTFLGIPTGPVSRLLLNSMNGLYNIVHHYALSIVLLTIILKAILWPLQGKANRSMKKMAALSPQMKELQERYKSEPQKYQQEMGKLFKKAGVNPLSGCWPILIQIPIFMGFYNMLGKAVELRHQGFWWVSDLSAPDTVGHLFGLPINPLPLIMAVTMIAQMKLAPQGGDPAQRKMMMLMPIVFILMCYNFASALALYWAVQNIISIIQLFVNRAKEASQRQPAMVK